jgi:hypothetical protein
MRHGICLVVGFRRGRIRCSARNGAFKSIFQRTVSRVTGNLGTGTGAKPVEIETNRFLQLCGWLDPDPIVHGLAKSLFAAQVFLCRLDRDMTQKKLDLFQFAACGVTETGARSSEIV